MLLAAWHMSNIRAKQLRGNASTDFFAELVKVNDQYLRMAGEKIFDDNFLRVAAREYGADSFAAVLFKHNGGQSGLYA